MFGYATLGRVDDILNRLGLQLLHAKCTKNSIIVWLDMGEDAPKELREFPLVVIGFDHNSVTISQIFGTGLSEWQWNSGDCNPNHRKLSMCFADPNTDFETLDEAIESAIVTAVRGAINGANRLNQEHTEQGSG